jgi:hypothetical protein
MNRPSSHRVFGRFKVAIFAMLGLLLIAIALQNIKKKFEFDTDGIFVPISLINQTKVSIQVIQTGKGNYSTINFPCSERQHLVLAELISEKTKYTIDQSKDLVKNIWGYLDKENLEPSCKTFPQVIKNSFMVLNANKEKAEKTLDRAIRERYVENVGWEKSPLCLYAKDELGFYLANGSYAKCKHEKIEFAENSEKRNLIRKEIQPIILLSKNQGQLKKEQNPLYLSIDTNLQYQLKKLLNCDNSCPNAIQRIINKVDFAAITIIDSDTNEILAVACHGSKCDSSDNKYLGLLKGANIEVPPASTAKLIFSLAIAQNNPAIQKELEFQIKTSGQLDQFVTKRNEWWEKIVTCNNSKNCEIPRLTEFYAKQIGWNQYCDERPNLECGKSSILSPLGINQYSPRSGRILIQSDKNGPYLNKKNLDGQYLTWKVYDEVRTGKNTSNNLKLLEKTTLVVQSVIGAGDNRTTSLGLAMLSAAIYESNTKGKISNIKLFHSKNIETKDLPMSIGKSVFKGMQKVSMPAEKNWVGDGTANSAFINAFGMPCKEDCPIFAKTGTVSKQDKVYGGTTLFTAISLNEALGKKIGQDLRFANRNFAIGVVSKPKQNESEHLASKLGMHILKEVNLSD